MFATYPECFAGITIEPELDFPIAEYHERLALTRSAMAADGLDMLILRSLANICYLCGFQTPSAGTFAALFIPATGRPILQLIDHEYACARYTSCIEDIRSYPWYLPEHGRELSRAILDELLPDDRSTFRIGYEPSAYALLPDLNRLAVARGALVQTIDAGNLVNQLRRIKSPAEIAALRESGRIAVDAIDFALDRLRADMTDNQLAALMHQKMIEAGCEFVNMGPFVATGVRSSLIHTTNKRRPITSGDPVFLELACPYKRYNAPVMRSAVVGGMTSTIERLVAAVEATLGRLLGTIRAGRTGHEVALEAAKGFASIRDDIYFQGAFGYTVGLGLPPNWAEDSTPFIAAGVEEPLLAGMTFHLPVAARIVGLGGVALSETVLVTESGCECLTADNRSFRVV